MKRENDFHIKSFLLLASIALLHVFLLNLKIDQSIQTVFHAFNFEYLFLSSLKSHRKQTFQMAHMSRFYVLLIKYLRGLIMEMYQFLKRTWNVLIFQKNKKIKIHRFREILKWFLRKKLQLIVWPDVIESLQWNNNFGVCLWQNKNNNTQTMILPF